jgi:hypothetical protein
VDGQNADLKVCAGGRAASPTTVKYRTALTALKGLDTVSYLIGTGSPPGATRSRDVPLLMLTRLEELDAQGTVSYSR